MTIKRGDQIAYIPMHAEGAISHTDVEFGFVTSVRGNTAFCRYWRKGQMGVLRTVANSEGTPIDSLEECPSVPQSTVDELLGSM